VDTHTVECKVTYYILHECGGMGVVCCCCGCVWVRVSAGGCAAWVCCLHAHAQMGHNNLS
jgi:hypothetical protein